MQILVFVVVLRNIVTMMPYEMATQQPVWQLLPLTCEMKPDPLPSTHSAF